MDYFEKELKRLKSIEDPSKLELEQISTMEKLNKLMNNPSKDEQDQMDGISLALKFAKNFMKK